MHARQLSNVGLPQILGGRAREAAIYRENLWRWLEYCYRICAP